MKHVRLLVSAMTALMLALTLVVMTNDNRPEATQAAPEGSSATAPATTDAVKTVAKKDKWRPWRGGSMNIPRSGREEFNNERRVIDAINHTRKGEEIRMVMFSYDRWPVTDALLRARKRKVRVKVIINNHELTPAARRLRDRLGKKRSHKNFFYQCRASCRGQGDVQHSKFVLISKSGAAKNVVMLGSLNMKQNGTHNQFNDLFVMTGRPAMYKFMKHVFYEMRRDRLAKPSYLRQNFGKTTRLWVLPFPRGNKATKKTRYTVNRDPMTQILNKIDCNNGSRRTKVRVSMHAWDKERGLMIAKKFRKLWDQGCELRIDVGFAGRAIRQLFAQPTRRGYMRVRSSAFDTNYDGIIDKYSHLKLLLVDGNYAGKRNRKVVVTGSSNYQNGGQYGDELIMRVYNDRNYNQYIRNWNRLYYHYTHGFVRMGNNYRLAGGPILTNGVNDKMPDWRDE